MAKTFWKSRHANLTTPAAQGLQSREQAAAAVLEWPLMFICHVLCVHQHTQFRVSKETKNNNNRIQRRSLRFLTISSLRRELSPTRTLKWPRHNRVKITCNTSSAYHVQRVVCHLAPRDSSAIKYDRVEIAFTLTLLYWLKSLTDEGGEETGAPGRKPLDDGLQNMRVNKTEPTFLLSALFETNRCTVK